MFQEIIENVFAFISPNQGSNVYLIKDKTIALIDSSLSMNSELLKKSLSALNLSPKDISFILHTHGHADHFSNSFLFQNAKKMMHPFDAQKVNEKDNSFTYNSFLNEFSFPKIDLFFSENETIKLGKFSLKVIFTPGHTAGSVCFFEEKNKLLFSGDTLFNNAVGRTDLNSSSSEQLNSSLKKLSSLEFNYLFPGHGSLLLGEKENKSNLCRLLAFL